MIFLRSFFNKVTAQSSSQPQNKLLEWKSPPLINPKVHWAKTQLKTSANSPKNLSIIWFSMYCMAYTIRHGLFKGGKT